MFLADPSPTPEPSSGTDLPINIPDLPDGTPGWVYAVVFAAVAIVVVIVKLPSIIDGLNSLLGRDKKAPAPVQQQVAPPPTPGPQEQAVANKADDLSGVVEWLQDQVEKADTVNGQLQDRINSFTTQLSDVRVEKTRLESENAQLRAENTVLRQSPGGFRGGGY